MRKISAHYVFPIHRPPVRGGVLTLSDEGEVLDLAEGSGAEGEGVEFYSGILAPGLVNAHCHLELSHLRGSVPQRTGMAGFIAAQRSARSAFTGEQVASAIAVADAQLYAGGTVAVGDIANSNATFAAKARSRIFYHTFIERYGLRDEDAAPALRTATALAGEAQRLGLQASLTPHAPYSTSAALYAALLERSRAWSVHNQESREEHQLFAQGSGALHALFARMGLTPPPPTGASSIHHTLRHAHSLQRLLLVHNTTTTAADYEAAAAACRRLWWVLCPSSNLYIHGQLPPVALLRAKGAALAVGTDSLASTGSLNVLDELKLLAHHFPHIPLHETLRWATLGGAEALGMAQTLGSLEKGKRPGVALISGIDFDNMRLTPASCARRL